MASLFDDLGFPLRDQDRHDPGGKVRLRLPSGIRGGARFSACGQYRPLLWRHWGATDDGPYMLWIGMNPSTADGEVNDPTVAREIEFTIREGFSSYMKCNVMDYRATDQKELRKPSIEPCSAENLLTIGTMAERAAKVVVCFGKLHPRVTQHGQNVLTLLRSKNIQPLCLGTNGDGSPKHPLYLAKDTKFAAYPA